LTAAVAAGKWTVQTAYEIGTISKYVKRNMNNAAYQAENMFLEEKRFVFHHYLLNVHIIIRLKNTKKNMSSLGLRILICNELLMYKKLAWVATSSVIYSLLIIRWPDLAN
jgi:hypothetical protein